MAASRFAVRRRLAKWSRGRPRRRRRLLAVEVFSDMLYDAEAGCVRDCKRYLANGYPVWPI